jgi:hypothetical protein
MNIFLTLVSSLLVASTATASGDRTRALAELERREPGLDEVRTAALRYAGLNHRPERGWSRRARMAGLLPALTLQAQRGTAEDEELSRSSTGTQKLDVGAGADLDLEARAVWQLDRLVFDEVELRALQTAQKLHRDRIQLLAQVTNLYFQRRKLQVMAIWSPPSDPTKAALDALAIAELTAQLDALTGGHFSRALLARARPGPAR